MDIFSKVSILQKFTLGLVVLNLVSLFFLVKKNDSSEGRKPKHDFKELSEILKRELQLSPTQEEAFIDLREDFFRKERTLKTLIRSQRDSMNAEMFNAKTDTHAVRQIAARVSHNEYKMETYRMDQAIKLKSICTPAQMEKFEHMVKEIRDYFKPVKEPK